MLNTPTTFAIYVAGLMFEWLVAQGGVAAIERANVAKARRSTRRSTPASTAIRCAAGPLADERAVLPARRALDAASSRAPRARASSASRATAVGGMRASLYNAMPLAGVEALTDWMREFERPMAGRMAGDAATTSPTPRLRVHREAIDVLDREILARLNERAMHAQAIGALKAGGRAPAYRPEREAQVLARLRAAEPRTAAGRRGHRRVPPGHVGVPRARAEAADRLPRSRGHVQPRRGRAGISAQFVDALPCATIDEVFRAGEAGQADYAVVPVENSTEGAVGRTLDLMCSTDAFDLRRNQAARPAEPAVERQRRSTDVTQGLFARAVARAMRAVARATPAGRRSACRWRATPKRRGSPRAEPGAAAIAGEIAAAIYGLDVLAPHIEDEPNNTTRFWVLGRQTRAAVRPRRDVARDVGAEPARARCTRCSSRSPRTACR